MLSHRVLMASQTKKAAEGIWRYSLSNPKYFYAHDSYDDYEYGEYGDISIPGSSGLSDSLNRPYIQIGGYRYTQGRTLVDTQEYESFYKICQTEIGVEAPSTGD